MQIIRSGKMSVLYFTVLLWVYFSLCINFIWAFSLLQQSGKQVQFMCFVNCILLKFQNGQKLKAIVTILGNYVLPIYHMNLNLSSNCSICFSNNAFQVKDVFDKVLNLTFIIMALEISNFIYYSSCPKRWNMAHPVLIEITL